MFAWRDSIGKIVSVMFSVTVHYNVWREEQKLHYLKGLQTTRCTWSSELHLFWFSESNLRHKVGMSKNVQTVVKCFYLFYFFAPSVLSQIIGKKPNRSRRGRKYAETSKLTSEVKFYMVPTYVPGTAGSLHHSCRCSLPLWQQMGVPVVMVKKAWAGSW